MEIEWRSHYFSVRTAVYLDNVKLCGMCGSVKPFNEFHLYSRQGHQAWCKACRKEYDRAYHARNAEKRRLQVKAARFRLVGLNRHLKALGPCADCGGRFHPAAMEWDHLPGNTKRDDVSSLARAGKTKQFHAELSKCELVCANCHAVRSYERRATGRSSAW